MTTAWLLPFVLPLFSEPSLTTGRCARNRTRADTPSRNGEKRNCRCKPTVVDTADDVHAIKQSETPYTRYSTWERNRAARWPNELWLHEARRDGARRDEVRWCEERWGEATMPPPLHYRKRARTYWSDSDEHAHDAAHGVKNGAHYMVTAVRATISLGCSRCFPSTCSVLFDMPVSGISDSNAYYSILLVNTSRDVCFIYLSIYNRWVDE